MIPFFLFLCFFSPRIVAQASYAVVVDAGSSGTRSYIYEWHDLASDVTEVYSHRVEPGLSSYVDNLPALITDFRSFLEESLTHLPSSAGRVSFYLGATAGLRLCTSYAAEQIINTVLAIVKDDFPYLLVQDPRQIRVLSGEEEGVFGWAASQYLREAPLRVEFLDEETMVGALDLGGASTQISFRSNEELLQSKITARLLDETVEVFSMSFLRYGVNQGFDLSLLELERQQGISGNLTHPCRNTGTEEYDISRERWIIGTSNVSACEEVIDHILHLNDYCPFERCGPNGIYLPAIPAAKTFYAFSNYRFVVEGLKMQDLPKWLVGDILSSARGLCVKDFEDVVADSGFPREFVLDQCFNAFFAMHLLTSYGFPLESDQIQFLASVKGKTMTWTLGMLLFENGLADCAECHHSSRVNSAAIVLGTLFGVSLIGCVLLLFLVAYLGIRVCQLVRTHPDTLKEKFLIS